jgi:hypothetical protein
MARGLRWQALKLGQRLKRDRTIDLRPMLRPYFCNKSLEGVHPNPHLLPL